MESFYMCILVWGLPWWLSGKESACQCRRCRRHGFSPWVGKIPWRRKWQPAPVFLPENAMDRGAWWAIVHGVAKTQTTLSDWAHTHTLYDHRNHVQNTSRIPALFLTPLPNQLPRGCFSEHQLVMPLPEPHSSGIMQHVLFVSGFFWSSWCLCVAIHAMHVSLSFNR